MKIKEAFVCNQCLTIFSLNEKENCPECNSNDITSIYEIYNKAKYDFLLTYSDEDIEELLAQQGIELNKQQFDKLMYKIKKKLENVDCWVCIETAFYDSVEELKMEGTWRPKE